MKTRSQIPVILLPIFSLIVLFSFAALQSCSEDDPQPGQIIMVASLSPLGEDAGSQQISVDQQFAQDAPVVVAFTFSGSATNGTDYNFPTTVTIPAGETLGLATFEIIDDDDFEGVTEDVVITASAVTSGNATISSATLTTSIRDNECEVSVTWLPEVGTNPDVDLDLYYDNSGNWELVSSSNSITPGESVVIEGSDANGNYLGVVEYFSGQIEAAYTMTASYPDGAIFTRSGVIGAGTANVLLINKLGDSYSASNATRLGEFTLPATAKTK